MITLIDKMYMRKIFYFGSALAVSLLLNGCGSTEKVTQFRPVEINYEEELSQQSVDAVLWFRTSPEAALMYRQGYDLARQRLKENMGRVDQHGTPAVILDLDETVLDNSRYQAECILEGKTFSEESWAEWVVSARATALPGALEFVQFCEMQGVEVYYISNRSEEHIEATITNLNRLGFPFADRDHVLLKRKSSDKTERRNQVSERHTVLLLCGDNLRDFSEEFSAEHMEGREMAKERMGDNLTSHFVLFPNPMYGEWLSKYNMDNDSEELQLKLKGIEESLR